MPSPVRVVTVCPSAKPPCTIGLFYGAESRERGGHRIIAARGHGEARIQRIGTGRRPPASRDRAEVARGLRPAPALQPRGPARRPDLSRPVQDDPRDQVREDVLPSSRALSTWNEVRDAPPDELEDLIREARPRTDKDRPDLVDPRRDRHQRRHSQPARLRSMADAEVEHYLTSLPGVARKTALCVMLYTLDREVLPVDTHVWRVARAARPCSCRESGARGGDASWKPQFRKSCGGRFTSP